MTNKEKIRKMVVVVVVQKTERILASRYAILILGLK